MTATVFILAFLTSIATYLVVSARLVGGQRAAALSRLVGKLQGKTEDHRKPRPALIQMAGAVRGRLTTHLLERLSLKQSVEQALETANLRWGASGLVHRCGYAFLATFAVVTLPTGNRQPVLALGASALAACVPYYYVRRKAANRVAQFEQQFPDCLEFISRSMRAGHAFSVSLEMVFKEFSDPLAAEFRRIFEEQNLGQPLEIVLKKLANRVPSMDAQFFVSAVLLQKRTGGNLAELLDKLAHIIRERFKLRARIRAVSAQGLMSGRILASIPFAVGVLMFMINPQYARFFIDDPMGHQLLAGALGMQLVGYLIILKIVKIEV
jgi:tight adherence protein B